MERTPEVQRELGELVSRLFGEQMPALRSIAQRIHPDVHDGLPGEAAGPRVVVERLIEALDRRGEFDTFATMVAETLGESLDVGRLIEIAEIPMPSPTRLAGDAPFIGLHSFSSKQAALFFGRTALIDTILRAVTGAATGAVFLVHGLGGVGKSSLLRAGVIPRVGAGVCRYQRCIGFIADKGFVCVDDPDDGPPGERIDLWIIDQFEAGFLHLSPEQRASDPVVIEHLQAFLATTGGSARIILAFKQEYLADVEALLLACGGPPPRRIAIAPMRYEEVLEVLLAPTQRPPLRRAFSFDYDDGLAPEIAADLCRDRASPVAPTLQLLMRELWARRKFPDTAGASPVPRIRRESYAELKVAGGYLQTFVLAQLKPDAPLQGVYESGLVFDLLWYLMDDTTLTGRARTLGFVADNFPRHDVLRAVIEGYCVRGLLVEVTRRPDQAALRAADREREFRLVHDSLVPILLAECRTSQRPGIRAARVLRTRAAASDEPGVPLLTAEQLALVEFGIDAMHRPTGRELEVLTSSREQRAIERARVRMRWRLGGLAVGASLVMLASWAWTFLSYVSATQQNLARSLALHADHEVRSQNPQAALVLARRALELEAESEGGAVSAVIDRALRDALGQRLTRQTWQLGEGGPRDLLWMQGGGLDAPVVMLAPTVGGPEVWRDGERIEKLAVPVGGQAVLYDLAATAQGDLVAAASLEGYVYLWDLRGDHSPQVLRLPTTNTALLSVALAADGQMVAAGAIDGRVFVWDRQADRPGKEAPWRHTAAVNALSFVGQDRLASVGSDGRLYAGDPVGTNTPSESRHGEELYAIAAAGAGVAAVYGGERGQLYLLAGDPAPLPEPATKASWAPVHALQWSADGDEIVSAHGDGKVRLWNVVSGTSQLGVAGEFSAHAGAVQALGLDPVGSQIYTAGQDGEVHAWDLEAPLGEPRTASIRDQGSLRGLRVEGMPPRVVARVDKGCEQSWEAASLRAIARQPGCVAAAVDASVLASGDRVRLRTVEHQLRVEHDDPDERDEVLAERTDWRLGWLTSDGMTVVALTTDGELGGWRRAGETWRSGPALRHGVPIQAGELGPDGRWLVYADTDGGLFRWEVGVAARGLKIEHGSENVAAVRFSRDGRWLAAGGRGRQVNLQLWRWSNLDSPPIDLGEANRRIVDLVFLPEGEAVVVATDDGQLRRHATLAPLADAACKQLRREPPVFVGGDAVKAMLGGAPVCGDIVPVEHAPGEAPTRERVAQDIEFSGCDGVVIRDRQLRCVYFVDEAADADRLILWVPGAGSRQCKVAIDDRVAPAEENVMDDGLQLKLTPPADSSLLALDCGAAKPWTLGLEWVEETDRRPLERLLGEAPRAPAACDRGLAELGDIDDFWRYHGYRTIAHRCLQRAVDEPEARVQNLNAAMTAVEAGVAAALSAGQLDQANAIVLGAVFKLNWELQLPHDALALLQRHRAVLERVPADRATVANFRGGIYFAGGLRQQRDAEAELRRGVASAHYLGQRDEEFAALQTLAEVLNYQRREAEADLLLARAGELVPPTEPGDCDRGGPLLALNRGWAALVVLEAQRGLSDPRPWLRRALELYRTPECAGRVTEETANATANLAYAECLMGKRGRAAELRAELAADRPKLSPRLQRFIELKLDRCIDGR